jgi:hypothetical protein
MASFSTTSTALDSVRNDVIQPDMATLVGRVATPGGA